MSRYVCVGICVSFTAGSHSSQHRKFISSPSIVYWMLPLIRADHVGLQTVLAFSKDERRNDSNYWWSHRLLDTRFILMKTLITLWEIRGYQIHVKIRWRKRRCKLPCKLLRRKNIIADGMDGKGRTSHQRLFFSLIR